MIHDHSPEFQPDSPPSQPQEQPTPIDTGSTADQSQVRSINWAEVGRDSSDEYDESRYLDGHYCRCSYSLRWAPFHISTSGAEPRPLNLSSNKHNPIRNSPPHLLQYRFTAAQRGFAHR
ncbi:MAG: hypothetical protein U5J63_11285 [Fodinibius sp.]|nr:hypothetical protein [Fodinibius sp.]